MSELVTEISVGKAAKVSFGLTPAVVVATVLQAGSVARSDASSAIGDNNRSTAMVPVP